MFYRAEIPLQVSSYYILAVYVFISNGEGNIAVSLKPISFYLILMLFWNGKNNI